MADDDNITPDDFFEPETDLPSFSPLQRLNADLKLAARLLPRDKIQEQVQAYYRIQDVRKAAANQRRSKNEEGSPNKLVTWLSENWRLFEGDVKKTMGEVADEYRTGQWLLSIVGIGPVLASGWLSGLDLSVAVTVGHWWRLCGLDPSVKWLGRDLAEKVVTQGMEKVGPSIEEVVRYTARWLGIRWEVLHKWATTKKDGTAQPLNRTNLEAAAARRPWSNRLKVLAWKTSDCFVKFCHHKKQFYGSVYLDRKEYEARKNEARDYATLAQYKLAGTCHLCHSNNKVNYPDWDYNCPVCHGRPIVKPLAYGKDTDAYKYLMEGKLPPAHIHARCMRYAVKMFLSHLHHVMYLDVKGVPPPLPFAFTKAPGNHRHFLPPPNLDLEDPWEVYKGRSLAEMQ
jgi:hypothetical protein